MDSLYVIDVETRAGQLTVSIIRRPDNPLDSRRDQPSVKTLERVVPISEELARILMEYLASYRGNAKHPFLFVGRNSKSLLGLAQISQIFAALRGIHPALAKLAPHDARRTFNDFFFKKAVESKEDPIKAAALQNYVNGWSSQSKQAQVYARREIEVQAMGVVRNLQKDLYRI